MDDAERAEHVKTQLSLINRMDEEGGELTFRRYRYAVLELASYPLLGRNLLYPAMGAAGEAGECLDKVKKYWRNSGVKSVLSANDLTAEERKAVLIEAGDALWYIAAIAKECGVALEDVARMNIEKLFDRAMRNVIKGEGDSR